jgi:guanosine-3',5'-bis(diphosphate) 3'-pyrophosphohydrolase
MGVMLKITHVISGEANVNMQSITIDSKDGLFEGIIKVFVKDTQQLQELMDHLKDLEGILTVTRFEDQPENESAAN